MEITSILNIKPKTQRSIGSSTGLALGVESFTHQQAESFKSSFKLQADKNSPRISRAEKEKETALPQNGNELPNKKNNRISNDESNNTAKKTHSEQTKNSERNHSREPEKSQPENSREPDNVRESDNGHGKDKIHERNNSREPGNSSESDKTLKAENSHEEVSDFELAIHLEQDNSKQFYSELNNQNENVSSTVSFQSDRAIDKEFIEHEEGVEPYIQSDILTKGNNTDEITTISPNLIIPNSVNKVSDNTPLRPTSNLQIPNQISDTDKLLSDIASKAGTHSKNESSLSKNIADFQQYIEMSKKHSLSNEVTSSVKIFKHNLKANQANVPIVGNEIKLPVNQVMESTQMTTQSMSLDRVNSIGSLSSTSVAQNLPALEVKTTVGKSGWNQGFSNQIVMMATNGIKQATIKMNPMHLGPVEATVKLTAEAVVVNLSSMHVTTRESMENAIPRLKEMLNENGFLQVDVNVSHQDKKEQQEANLGSNTGSNNEHGNSTMPGDEQLSEVIHDPESDVQAADSRGQDLNIVDYYA